MLDQPNQIFDRSPHRLERGSAYMPYTGFAPVPFGARPGNRPAGLPRLLVRIWHAKGAALALSKSQGGKNDGKHP